MAPDVKRQDSSLSINELPLDALKRTSLQILVCLSVMNICCSLKREACAQHKSPSIYLPKHTLI